MKQLNELQLEKLIERLNRMKDDVGRNQGTAKGLVVHCQILTHDIEEIIKELNA